MYCVGYVGQSIVAKYSPLVKTASKLTNGCCLLTNFTVPNYGVKPELLKLFPVFPPQQVDVLP